MSAWLAQFKLYLFGALLLAAGFGYWWHGHESYKSGKAAGDKEVAALKAQYTTASEQAAAASRAMQSMYDAQALAEANRRTQQSEFQLSIMTTVADTARAQADQFAAKLQEARKHDKATAAWLDAPVPAAIAGLHAASEGGGG